MNSEIIVDVAGTYHIQGELVPAIIQRRRRDIFVEPDHNQFQAPSEAAYHVAPTGL